MEYKPIKEFEGKYIVSSAGEIINIRTGHILVGEVKNSGYRMVILSDSGRMKNVNIHRIVADAFCEKKDGCNEVNHINGNKLDNRAENLEWVSRKENLQHAFETGLMENSTVPKQVIATSIENGETMIFPSIYKAARFLGISQGNICMACKGERHHAGGYFWRYAE